MPTIDEALKAAYAECKPYDIMARDLRVLIMANEGFHDQVDVIFYKNKEMTKYDLFREQVERLKNNDMEYICLSAILRAKEAKLLNQAKLDRILKKRNVTIDEEQLRQKLATDEIDTPEEMALVRIEDNVDWDTLVAKSTKQYSKNGPVTLDSLLTPNEIRYGMAEIESIDATFSKNTGLTLIMALSYSSRWEIKEALKAIVRDSQNGNLKAEDVTEETLRSYLATRDFPDPDLLIRTGGEQRTSNFLQWQMAYTEFYFSEVLWPDFEKEHFYEAVRDFQGRQRRFGKTGDQVESKQ